MKRPPMAVFFSVKSRFIGEITYDSVGEGLINCGMIATGNHIYLDSLRGAPPSLSENSTSMGEFSAKIGVYMDFTPSRGEIHDGRVKTRPYIDKSTN